MIALQTLACSLIFFGVEARYLTEDSNAAGKNTNAAKDSPEEAKPQVKTQESPFKFYALICLIVVICAYLLFRYIKRNQSSFEQVFKKISLSQKRKRKERLDKSLAQQQPLDQFSHSKEKSKKGYRNFEQQSEFIQANFIDSKQNSGLKSRDQLDRTPEDLELDIFQGNNGPKKDLNSVFEKRTESSSLPSSSPLTNEVNSPRSLNQNGNEPSDSSQQLNSNNVKSKLRSRIAGKAKVVDEEQLPQQMF